MISIYTENKHMQLPNFNTSYLDKIKTSWELQDHVMSGQIQLINSSEEIADGGLVLVSFSEKMGKSVSHILYGYTELKQDMYDVGLYVSNDLHTIFEFLADCFAREITCIIISEIMDDTLYHHLQEDFPHINYSCSIDRTFKEKNRLYENQAFVTLGNQRHRAVPLDKMKAKNMLLLGLGELRQHIFEMEPYMRSAQLCDFNLAAVRSADAPAQRHPSSSGLFSEEGVQLARFAGSSAACQLFWIHGFEPSKEIDGRTADFVAQLIWYFIDGMALRFLDEPMDNAELKTYIVEDASMESPLYFYKSEKSGRWWIKSDLSIHGALVPCSIQDYEQAKSGDFSDRLVQLIYLHTDIIKSEDSSQE